MATMRFSLTGVVSRETETGSWVKTNADCLGIRIYSKMGCSESMNNVGWIPASRWISSIFIIMASAT